ncbi:hypothetical protein E3N88_38732 [Mikania micrantha]|uniref:Uncharacterized protein n=1 Tax=Mikania micrantha TaxID=192012 RepID=A0A5N6LVN7_9ASTR|nr:hypothetical protein E3N88_38732 [Mikania micrantha]
MEVTSDDVVLGWCDVENRLPRSQNMVKACEAARVYSRSLAILRFLRRDDEMKRCVQILSRRRKNNPVIIGEPGVGKNAILEGAKFGGVKCSYGRVDIMRSFQAKSYGSEMFIND